MKTSEFDYQLPKSFIAMEPRKPRDSSRLMVLDKKKGTMNHKHFYDLVEILDNNYVLVFNNSKVIPARILFEIDGKSMEIFILKKIEDNFYECLAKPGKKFELNAIFRIHPKISVKIERVNGDGTRLIRFLMAKGTELRSYLNELGQVPFPPYLEGTKASFEDYQTVYSKTDGSVAAPTAGLHFTENLLGKLREKGVGMAFATLHVGLGTFQPVKTEIVEEHKMHSEIFELDQDTADFLNNAKQQGKKIVAVGTTSVRILESCSNKNGKINAKTGETSIFIYPGYEWKFVDAMITNFHLPKSTLLMLISSFAGKDSVFKAYEEAKKQNYRFFSFGDAMLII
jgi:S-adenosylmethionine:tRNA ribosyltransferase-isomerase